MKQGRIKKLFKRKSVWAVFYAVYLALILLSVNALYAEVAFDTIVEGMEPTYKYHLTFRHDGVTTHYDVVRHDNNAVGKIDLTYQTDINRLEIDNVENIKELTIDVESLFDDEAAKVFKYNPTEISGMDLAYWMKAGGGIFTVVFNIDSDEKMENLTFSKFPTPSSVLVDNEEWWTTNINYTVSGNEITISDIPSGKETTVIINFNEIPNKLPLPDFTMVPSPDADVDEDVSFDATGSSDPDGNIITYIWNFGEGGNVSGADKVTIKHAYSTPGEYTVRLTVRDNAEPLGQAWKEKTINVRYGAGQDTDSDGLPDFWEWDNFNDITSQNANGDADSDGYANGLEYLAGTVPADNASFDADSDADTLPDTWEWQYFKDLDDGVDDDPDADGASNKKEQEADTDPTSASSKPSEPKDDEDKGLLNMGKMGPLDTFIILILVIVIILIVVVAGVMRSKKSRQRAAEEAERAEAERLAAQARRQPPMRRPPTGPPGVPPGMAAVAAAPAPMPMPSPEPAPMPMPEPMPMPMPMPSEAEELPPMEEASEDDAAVGEPARDDVLSSFAAELDIGLFEAGILYDSGYTSFEAMDGVLSEELAMIDEIDTDTAERIVGNLAFVTGAAAAGEAVSEEAVPEEEPVEEELPAEEEEAPAEEEAEAEEEAAAMECPVCGEPVEAGTTNCPVCDSPM